MHCFIIACHTFNFFTPTHSRVAILSFLVFRGIQSRSCSVKVSTLYQRNSVSMETGFFFGAANFFFIEKLSAITIIINCYCHSCTVESKSLGSWNHNHFTFWSHKLFSKFPFHFMSNFPFLVNLKKPACAFKQDGLVLATLWYFTANIYIGNTMKPPIVQWNCYSKYKFLLVNLASQWMYKL